MGEGIERPFRVVLDEGVVGRAGGRGKVRDGERGEVGGESPFIGGGVRQGQDRVASSVSDQGVLRGGNCPEQLGC